MILPRNTKQHGLIVLALLLSGLGLLVYTVVLPNVSGIVQNGQLMAARSERIGRLHAEIARHHESVIATIKAFPKGTLAMEEAVTGMEKFQAALQQVTESPSCQVTISPEKGSLENVSTENDVQSEAAFDEITTGVTLTGTPQHCLARLEYASHTLAVRSQDFQIRSIDDNQVVISLQVVQPYIQFEATP